MSCDHFCYCGKKINSGKTCGECRKKIADEKRVLWIARRDSQKKETAQKRTQRCPVCGATFTRGSSPQKSCSKKCGLELTISKNKKLRKFLKCENCGGELPESRGVKTKFCSKDCVYENQKKSLGVSCFRCGASFSIRPSGTKKYMTGKKSIRPEIKRNFCSKECHLLWQKETRKREQSSEKKIIFSKARRMIRNAISFNREHKNFKAIFGYSKDELRAMIVGKFSSGMTLENYGKWHVDHIIPVSKFNYSGFDDVDFKRCWSLKNLQPLWAKDNFEKTDKIKKPFQPCLAIPA